MTPAEVSNTLQRAKVDNLFVRIVSDRERFDRARVLDVDRSGAHIMIGARDHRHIHIPHIQSIEVIA